MEICLVLTLKKLKKLNLNNDIIMKMVMNIIFLLNISINNVG